MGDMICMTLYDTFKFTKYGDFYMCNLIKLNDHIGPLCDIFIYQ